MFGVRPIYCVMIVCVSMMVVIEASPWHRYGCTCLSNQKCARFQCRASAYVCNCDKCSCFENPLPNLEGKDTDIVGTNLLEQLLLSAKK